MEYKVLSALNVYSLNKQISSSISVGFEPFGSPFVYGGEICQAVQKTDLTIARQRMEAGVCA